MSETATNDCRLIGEVLPPAPAWHIEDGFLTTRAGGYEYDIDLRRCDTLEKILAWVVHLAGKTWATRQVLRGFILAATKAHGIDLDLRV